MAEMDTNRLTEAQRHAIQHVRAAAKSRRDRDRRRTEAILSRSGVPGAAWMDSALSCIAAYCCVTVNFHPDRVLPSGITVIEGLLREGRYRSQFETFVSNGSRTAYPGGDRDRWEELLFGGAYHTPDVPHDERPKYGALNIMNYGDGAAPRFGSCYLKLRPQVSDRCTFTFGDSHLGPECIGTGDIFEPLLASVVDVMVSERMALGTPIADLKSFTERILHLQTTDGLPFSGIPGRALDNYIEAQIHGDIDLMNDVAALVADPSFAGTVIGDGLLRLCSHYGIGLYWHSGFQLETEAVPDDFRGPAMPPLARRLDQQFTSPAGFVDAAAIGRAAASLQAHPQQWRDWGSYEETLQHLKQLWHVLVHFGRAYERV
ncbi:DUF3626 domain-containing protein [Paenibacillus spongiae]|uniref:DUF3626 domain-containing protein n=1 Tax=Paenibacillus spongiae TaxID=2909671 RepID=A0ABY5SJY2_9BACL|nr:DUF3626 domain-containing protein [Paenibacillus spongiae]UVI32913.1 DUF3626 domain-containing protein [Paenibacillus spongiae]